MPRRKTLSDDDLLDKALAVMRRAGPQGVSFATVSAEAGLSAPTLVQRFGGKEALLQAALVRAWDLLDQRTAAAVAAAADSPDGAIDLLTALSGDFGEGDDYAEGLLVLREDLRNPALRERGKRWGETLAGALADRLADADGPRPDLGRLMAAQWQGSVLWWGFSRKGQLPEVVRRDLTAFCRAIGRAG